MFNLCVSKISLCHQLSPFARLTCGTICLDTMKHQCFCILLRTFLHSDTSTYSRVFKTLNLMKKWNIQNIFNGTQQTQNNNLNSWRSWSLLHSFQLVVWVCSFARHNPPKLHIDCAFDGKMDHFCNIAYRSANFYYFVHSELKGIRQFLYEINKFSARSCRNQSILQQHLDLWSNRNMSINTGHLCFAELPQLFYLFIFYSVYTLWRY